MSNGAKVKDSEKAKGGGNARGGVLAREGGTDLRERVEERLHVGVSEDVLKRGLFLYLTGTLIQNTTYPWLYMVSGAQGDQVYQVDLLAGSCGCKGFEITGQVCKHIVAAGAAFVDSAGDGERAGDGEKVGGRVGVRSSSARARAGLRAGSRGRK